MTNFTLTVGADTVAGATSDDTVNGTAATLNAGDSLTAGAGTDTLALSGSGTFRVDQLATFTGFEGITLNNSTSDYALLYLGSQSISVNGYGSGPEQVYLGTGAVTFQGGGSRDYVMSTSASNWNARNSIDGGSVYLNSSGQYSSEYDNATYDLTTNTLTNVNTLWGHGNNLTVKVNSAVIGGIANFNVYATDAKLVTSDAALDLSHSRVSGFVVVSSNAIGTNFTVHDVGTALQVAGGSGTDTITAQGFVFSAAQRNAIFATASVEKIVDASGTYTVNNTWPFIIGGETATASIAENTTAVTTVMATDPDAGQTLSYSITGGADAGKFTIGSTIGALSFITPPNFELPTDAGGNNVYDVTVQVSDGHSGIDTQAIAVTVTDVVDTAATIISYSIFDFDMTKYDFYQVTQGSYAYYPSTNYVQVDWQNSGYYYSSIFTGSEMVIDADKHIIAGTVSGYALSWWNGSAWLPVWRITDFSTSASALYQAFVTPNTADDVAIIGSILSGNDIISTGTRNDRLVGSGGNDIIDGGAGIDIALYGGLRSQYQFERLSNGSLQVTDLRNGSPDGTDMVSNVELFQFADGTFSAMAGPPTTVIEANGSTRLTEVAKHFFLNDSTFGPGPSLKYAGADYVAGQFGAWAPIGAEKTASGYEVAWKNGSADQYTVWNTDSGGNYLSNIPAVSGADYALQLLEPSFQQDLNHDGQTGLRATVIEANGSTRLTEVAKHFFLNDSTFGSGPSLKYAGADYVAGQFGAWAPIGAEKTASG
jgi:Tryptophan-rich Synechocystis species C-terminal domain/Cadherin domain/RTX calcium-binding nonapeptide repeat (4 copies)